MKYYNDNKGAILTTYDYTVIGLLYINKLIHI